MKRYSWLLLLCIPLFLTDVAAKDTQIYFKVLELQRFSKAPSVELSQSFVDYFNVSLKQELQKQHVAAQVLDEGVAASPADAADVVVAEGKITSLEKHMMGIRSLSMEVNFYRKSDHRLITTIVPEAAYKGGFGSGDNQRNATYVGKMAAALIKKHLKDAPSLASLPPASPNAVVPANAAAVPPTTTAPGPSAKRLGIQARVLTDDEVQKLSFAQKTGVFVIRVEKDSVAELMQLQGGDVIVEVNGNKVAGLDQLRQMLGNGSNVIVKVWRNGSMQQLAV